MVLKKVDQLRGERGRRAIEDFFGDRVQREEEERARVFLFNF